MVSLNQVQASNAQIQQTYPEGLVAVFAGATAGIGETSLREFARHASKPRIYIVGRSQQACDRLDHELKTINPTGTYVFIRSDVSLLRNVDQVCRDIRSKETAINVLFMSQGTLNITKKTDEGLNYLLGLTYFGRMRMASNLLPLLQRATRLRRVVSSFTGAHDAKVYDDDWQNDAGSIPTLAARGHAASMMTMGLAALASRAPEVSFVHDFPGAVRTSLIRGDEGLMMQVVKYVFLFTSVFYSVPLREVGERHAFYCTSGKYPPREDGGAGRGGGVVLPSGVSVADGVDGEKGSGVYSIDGKGESAGKEVRDWHAKYRRDGTADRLWEYTEAEFERITGTKSI